MKKLFEIYYGFGKGEGYELGKREFIEDTEENRKDLIEDEFSYWINMTKEYTINLNEKSLKYLIKALDIAESNVHIMTDFSEWIFNLKEQLEKELEDTNIKIKD